MGSHAAAVFAAGGFLIALRVGKVEFSTAQYAVTTWSNQ